MTKLQNGHGYYLAWKRLTCVPKVILPKKRITKAIVKAKALERKQTIVKG